jgi:hypothetical protein
MAEWPSTVPAPIAESVEYVPQDNRIRTEMAAAVAKLRRRYTAVGEDVSLTLWLTGSQMQALQDFAIVTLKDVLPFNWPDFRRPLGVGNVRSYRFRNRPSFTYLGEGTWEARLQLEMLP